MTTKIE